MKKIKVKKNKYAIIAVVIGLALLVSVGVNADGGSFLDKVAQFVGVTVGNNLNQKINDSGVLDNLSADQIIGAMPGNELPGPCFSVGGVESCYEVQAMKSATSTICSIRSPRNSTSTLIFGSANFGYASSTGTVRVHLAKSAATNNSATTTALGATNMTAGLSGTLNATTTALDIIDDKTVFAPGEWFTVGLQGTTNYLTEAPSGKCVAEFRVNNR